MWESVLNCKSIQEPSVVRNQNSTIRTLFSCKDYNVCTLIGTNLSSNSKIANL